MDLDSSYKALAEKIKQENPLLLDRRINFELARIKEIASTAQQLVGKRVLDLGCGSKKSYDRLPPIFRHIQNWLNPFTKIQFDPWYCRILHKAGAHPIGIDIAENKTEEFENHSLDLLQINALERFENESFDAANNVFLSAPKESRHFEHGTSPSARYSLGLDDSEAIADFNEQLFKQVERLLKEGGTYTLAEFVFRKKRKRLKKEKTMKNW